MIKFFRKIRQKMLTENKFSKYLLYAVGEIILVVIGILIALQINDWNQQRKDRNTEQIILKRLQNEYKLNKNQLEDKVAIRNRMISNCKDLLVLYNNPTSANRDSIYVKISKLLTPATFDPIQNDIVKSGTLEILQSEYLKQLLIKWSTDVMQLQETEQMFFRYHEQNVVPYLDEIGLMRDVSYNFWDNDVINLLESKKYANPIPGKSEINSKTITDLLVDNKLESQITYTLTLNEFNNRESVTLMKRIDEILTVIKSEIKK
jgi:hypothetical protein